MKNKAWTKPAAAAMILGLVAAACGGDNKSGNSAATTTASSAAETTAASTGSSTASSTGSSTASSAAGNGQEALIPTGSGKYGQDPANKDVYKGAGDFSVDTTKCPSDWDPNQGISDKEIKLFISLPQSGPFAGFGLIADGMKNYFNYVNDNGGIGGKKITLDAKDDAYKPDQTKTNVDEALQSGNYASMVSLLGTPNNLGVWDELNQECMPQLFNATGAPDWGDVEGHPWTTGMQMDYFTEARLWVEWLKANKPNAKIATITINNDFGKSYLNGLKSAIKGTGITLVGDFSHDPSAPNVDNQYTSASASGADTLILQTSGVWCTQGMADVEKGAWKPTLIMSATCASLGQFFKPLIDQGLTGKDTYLIQYIKDPTDPSLADDPIVKLYNDQMSKAKLDPKQTTYFTGWLFGWYMTEVLQEANSYKGGLNRANVMVAARSIQQTNPLYINGLTTKVEGKKDAYLSEGGHMVKYTVTDPKQFGTFQPAGDLINLEGQLGTFATVKKAGS